MTGVEVRLRHVDEVRGHTLGRVPLTDGGVDDVLQLVGSWGLNAHGMYVEGGDIFGHFVLDDTGAYFELVADTTCEPTRQRLMKPWREGVQNVDCKLCAAAKGSRS